MTSMVDAALRYAGRGFPVFPCESHGKRPRTRNGLTDATTDPAVIERWWRADGNANVALVTGSASGLVVLDVDGDEGSETLRTLERDHEPLPRTASVVTPNGGGHYYFRHPGGRLPNTVRQLGAGLDTRGDGGYVLAPPSIGGNGRRYEPDERARLAEIPAWLLERLRTPQGARESSPASEWLQIVRGVEEGARNQSLARLVGHLLRRYVDVDLVAEMAQLVNGRFRPPLPAAEVDQIVDSIAALEARRRQRASS